MRFGLCLACIALVGCGSSGHDGAQAGKGAAADGGGGSSGRADATAGHDAAAAGHDGASAGKNAQAGAGHAAAGSGSESLSIPRVYPLVRAGTPVGLIADAAFRMPGDPSLDIFGDDAGTVGPGDSNLLAQVVQERLYSNGPTELLRIVSQIDGRTADLDTDPSRHDCLTKPAVTRTLMLPGGQSFRLQLQCLQQFTGGWLSFGFAPAAANADDTDAGAAAVSGNDFYLVQGQDGGMGAAFRIRGGSSDVEAWLTVADSRVPNNSQVIMHLWIDAASATTELALGGSSIGFCSAHLKTGHDHLFVRGKPNAPPPPGQPNGQYCGSEQAGCFSTTELNVNLGADAQGCAPVAPATFAIRTNLDASFDPEANVTPSTIYQYFNTMPEGIPAF